MGTASTPPHTSPPVLLTQPTHTESTPMTEPTERTKPQMSFFECLKNKLSWNRPTQDAVTPRVSSPVSSPVTPLAPAPEARQHKERRPRNTTPAEPPPAYSDIVSEPSYPRAGRETRVTSAAPSIASVTDAEDPYAFLSSFDTIFVVDDSGSMTGRSWRETKEALRSITHICTARDSDGIDLFFLNHKSQQPADAGAGKASTGYRGLTDTMAIKRIFETVRPWGGTPTGTRLQHILKPYLQLLERNWDDIESVKPVNIIVITDGVPSDDVEGVLLAAAKKLDRLEAPPYQVGIQFFQVGNERGAREALQELDDELSELVEGGARDMVDTVTWNAIDGRRRVLTSEGILKVVLGAVVRRLDRRDGRGDGTGALGPRR